MKRSGANLWVSAGVSQLFSESRSQVRSLLDKSRLSQYMPTLIPRRATWSRVLQTRAATANSIKPAKPSARSDSSAPARGSQGSSQVAQVRSHQSIAACYPEPRGREYQLRQPADSPARIPQRRRKTSGQEKSSSAFRNTILANGPYYR
jgi:hypothetical protein